MSREHEYSVPRPDSEVRQVGVTIRDVARAANVSISTVSHVLSGKRPTSGQTRRRVQDVIERLGYRPNRVAQSLVWRRPFALGLLIPDITNPYFPAFALGAEDRVRNRGYTLMLGNSEYDPRREASYLELVLANPPLTTVGQPIRQLGEQAADLLLRVIEDGVTLTVEASAQPNVLLPNELIVRQSTAPPARV